VAGQLHYALVLAERLPKLGELFAAGEVDFRVVSCRRWSFAAS
jgi:hypothetical protein